MRCFALLLTLFAAPLSAHEFWIEPLDYQIEADGSLQANIVNGQEFEGIKLPYLPNRFVNFLLFNGEDVQRVSGRPGDQPAMQQAAMGEGLHIAGYQATNATVDYETWENFQNFVDHKDLGDVLSRHEERGLPLENFKEIYSRHVKTLVAVGSGEGSDRRVGLETEIVALANPYTDDLTDGMPVQVYYRNDLRSDTQVEVFEKAADGSVEISYYRTDADGIARFPVKPGHSYMVDAVVLRVPNVELQETSGAVWETLWANLTFAVPE